jgi:hypothetical protein
MGYDPIDTDETDSNADKEITVDAINGADTSGAAAGEALTSDGSGSFIFAEVGGDTLTQMSEFLSQANMSQVAASQSDMQEVINTGLMKNVAASSTAMQEVAASSTAMQEVAASQTAIQEVIASQTAMQEVAASSTAMQAVANSQTALNEIGNNDIVQNTVYNNNTAIAELNNSNLAQNINQNINSRDTVTTKDDRTILLSHNAGANGSRINEPQFGASVNDFPQTADRIKRFSNSDAFFGTSISATFIDISDPVENS